MEKKDRCRERLDTEVARRGLAPSREKARALIMAGEVMVDGKILDKPGARISKDSTVTVKEGLRYVSRGGYKLEHALAVFPVTVEGRICLDAGASTGGFTDCLLQHGASRVIAVDVGYGQLAWKLRQDLRVVVMEKTNIRYLDPGELSVMPSLLTADLSFISLTKVLPVFIRLLPADGEIIALVKPQFEAGREKVGKKGVVRAAETHRQVLAGVLAAAEATGLRLGGITSSPLRGPEGNIEFLVYWKKQGEPVPYPDLDAVVAEAWQNDGI
ncbi:MAG TPA: TlyA family RNA methyltransferase [Firmicutes bacterium]|jgi:23S rRNA (cytidine1920-2'-O)/16S rRNA (cytidine1409-2'-O)-methyltransferase|nr:TlyA family RNA methyltransferase [Bacillota bacterium]